MSSNIFKKNHFSAYKKNNLNESFLIHDSVDTNKVTVFISHKHNDLDELRDFLGFLEEKYNVKCYIDSEDYTLPNYTNKVTAIRIKDKICKCKKFILLATDGAVDSKWCNWKLGYGDSAKTLKNVAIVPLSDKSYNEYRGNEYFEIYPHIVERKKGDKYNDGKSIKPGYYIREKNENNTYNLTPLEKWLNN